MDPKLLHEAYHIEAIRYALCPHRRKYMAAVASLRVAQANILNSRDRQQDRLKRLLSLFQEHRVAVVTLQEVPEPEVVSGALEAAGYTHMAFAPRSLPLIKGEDYVAIASLQPLSSAGEVGGVSGVVRGSLHLPQRTVHIYSAHLPWGNACERERLAIAEAIDEDALRKEELYRSSLSILGGDLNAGETSRTLRYLRGLDLPAGDGPSTHWTDAWVTCGEPADWATTAPEKNALARATARSVGVERPHALPARRIDYLLSRGWNYGRPGEPLAFGSFSKPSREAYSDHNAIWADFAL